MVATFALAIERMCGRPKPFCPGGLFNQPENVGCVRVGLLEYEFAKLLRCCSAKLGANRLFHKIPGVCRCGWWGLRRAESGAMISGKVVARFRKLCRSYRPLRARFEQI